MNISNIQVRRDINGELMDTHDGNIEQWEAGGLYYSYSMGYQVHNVIIVVNQYIHTFSDSCYFHFMN